MKYMLMYCYPNAGQNHNIEIAKKAKIRYLGMTVTNLSLIQVSSFSLTSQGWGALNETEMGQRKMVLLYYRLCNIYTMRIRKISSICQHCRCNTAVTMVRMHAVYWSLWKARMQVADNRTTFTHRPECLKCSRKSRCMENMP
jgi:hypothetical protein